MYYNDQSGGTGADKDKGEEDEGEGDGVGEARNICARRFES